MSKIKYIVLCLAISIVALAKEVPTKSSKLVNDFVGILSPQESQYLEQKLLTFSDSTSSQIAIVIENSLEGDEIFDYSMRLAQAWGIGTKDKNNGILLYIALQDRKIRIQVGYGLEGVITDSYSKQIIEEAIKPAFKQQQYFSGLNLATDQIMAAAKGEYKADLKKPIGKGKRLLITIAIILVVLVVLSRFNKNNNSNYGSGGMDWWTAALLGSALSRGGGRSYGDFSSGSGSFGGFGGGSFGGGGSGGDW